mmetsp:Transcript_19723/g.63408  ORF Transcript_19723/g.63408 Transcript_19723/m.63408 type:complete len:678 (+) Transcript_19723:70-2103(+)
MGRWLAAVVAALHALPQAGLAFVVAPPPRGALQTAAPLLGRGSVACAAGSPRRRRRLHEEGGSSSKERPAAADASRLLREGGPTTKEGESPSTKGEKLHLYPRPRRRRVERHGIADTFAGVALTSMIVVMVSFGHSELALASYAPSGAAVNSALPARKLNLDDFETLPKKKALQRERALVGIPLSDLLSQLDERLEFLQNQVRDIDKEESTSAFSLGDNDLFADVKQRVEDQKEALQKRRDDVNRELADKRRFEAELRKRAQVLKKLEEQPSWFNYAAAAAASVVSTVAMHPVDTIKTRLQADKINNKDHHRKNDDESDDGKGALHLDDDDDGKGAQQQYSAAAAAAGVAALRYTNGSSGVLSLNEYYPSSAIEVSAPLSDEQILSAAVLDLGGLGDDQETSAEGTTFSLETTTLTTPPLDTTKHDDFAEEKVFDLLSLYAGVSGNVAKEALPSALYLGVYEAVKASLLLTPTGAAMPLAVYLLAGGIGELCGSFFRAPAEAVKSLIQAGVAGSFAEAVAYIAATKESRRRVVRAWSASVIRDVPMGAIQISIFEGLKVYILNSPGISIDVNTLGAEAAIGALGGLAGALVTTPFDVATTRIITQSDDDSRDALAIMRDIVEQEGPLALFDGALQRGLYWAPAIGLFLSCYCSIRQFGAFDPNAQDIIQHLTHLFDH